MSAAVTAPSAPLPSSTVASKPVEKCVSAPSSAREKPAPPFSLQVRSLDPQVFHIETHSSDTILSIKQSIMNARGIDVIMQKLICKGALLADDSRVEECAITEDDFLVLVTAKPRPPSLVSTGAPLPSSYQSHLHGSGGVAGPGMDMGDGDDDDDVLDHHVDLDHEGEGEGEEDEGEEHDGLDNLIPSDGLSAHLGRHCATSDADAADEVARLVEMGFDAHDADHAMRLANNDGRRALALLRSGRLGLDPIADEAVRFLQDRLRSLPAFHALQQVVRVDPQIMLVLNTEAMRFEDPKTESLNGDGESAVEGAQEREAVEKAFWDACTLELTNTPPVYERTLQLVQEVRDTLCSLMPPHWDEQVRAAASSKPNHCTAPRQPFSAPSWLTPHSLFLLLACLRSCY